MWRWTLFDLMSARYISGVFELSRSVRVVWLFCKMFLRNHVAVPHGSACFTIMRCYYIGIYTTRLVWFFTSGVPRRPWCFRGYAVPQSVNLLAAAWTIVASLLGKKEFFCSPPCADQPRGPTKIPTVTTEGIIRGESVKSLELTTHFQYSEMNSKIWRTALGMISRTVCLSLRTL